MKTKSKPELHRFQLKLLAYEDSYYIDKIAELEAALAQKPRRLQIDMVGDGEIPADLALLMRSILIQRPAGTRIVTNARSSLRGASVLVWLLGDTRSIRDDARLFFRRANVPDDSDQDEGEGWKGEEPKDSESSTEADPEEADYAMLLQVINEFLPVKELAGRLVSVPMLRQFGLVQNEKLDQFLATAFAKLRRAADDAANGSKPKRTRAVAKERRPGPVRK